MRKCVIPLAVCVPEEGEEPAKTESEQPASTGETTAGEAEAGTKEEISDVHALAVHGLWQAICRKHIFCMVGIASQLACSDTAQSCSCGTACLSRECFLYCCDCSKTRLFRHCSFLKLRICMCVASVLAASFTTVPER